MPGNVVVITQLASHCAAAATASAEARMKLLNISPSITHTTGPQVAAKEATNTLAATSATGPATPPSFGSPSTMGAVAKQAVRAPRETAMPAAPASSSGRLPIRSTKAIATSVNATLTIELITDVSIASFSEKPTACHSEDE